MKKKWKGTVFTSVLLAGCFFGIPVQAEDFIYSLPEYMIPDGLNCLLADDGSYKEKMTLIDYEMMDFMEIIPYLWPTDTDWIEKDTDGDGEIDYLAYGDKGEVRGWEMKDNNGDGYVDVARAWEMQEDSPWQFKVEWDDLDQNGTMDAMMFSLPTYVDGERCGLQYFYYDCTVEPDGRVGIQVTDYTNRGEFSFIMTIASFPDHPLSETLTYRDFDGDGYADWGKLERLYDTNYDGVTDGMKQAVDHDMDGIFEDEEVISDSMFFNTLP